MRISLLRGLFFLILVSVNIGGHAESVASTDKLCPQSSDRASRTLNYGNLKKRITAPTSKDVIREQFRLLDKETGVGPTQLIETKNNWSKIGGFSELRSPFLWAKWLL